MADRTPVAFGVGDLNPLTWLGSQTSALVTDAWKAAMIALWSAGLWLLGLAFRIIDAFTTPDLSATGPLATVLPYTFALGAMVAAIMAFLQIGAALFQRDGRSLARVLVGVVQFGAVWIGYLAIAATLVTATGGLTTGLLRSMVHVNAFSGYATNSSSWPRQVDDTVVATVLGVCTVFLIIPAALGYVLIMLVREATLMLLTVTAPIAAGGLLSEGTRAWFWKTLRWFLACLMISPLTALVLGIGVKITQGVTTGGGDKTTAAVGMAVTGSVLLLIGALCPLVLFRLLAFVDPGTSSGAAMRQSLAASGGIAGLLSSGSGGSSGASGSGGSGASAGSGSATQQDGQGRSQGESSADSATQSRFASMLGPVGQVAQAGAKAVGTAAGKAASIGSDVLGSAGVGHQAPYFSQPDSATAGGSAPGGASARADHPAGSSLDGASPSGPAVPAHGSDGPTSDPGGGVPGGGAERPMPEFPTANAHSSGGSAAAGAAAEVPVVPA